MREVDMIWHMVMKKCAYDRFPLGSERLTGDCLHIKTIEERMDLDRGALMIVIVIVIVI